MRKILIIIFLLLTGHVFAQTSEIYERAGDSYLRDRNYQAAFESYSKAIKKSDRNNVNLSVLYFKRGESLSGSSNTDAALKDYDRAIELNPKYGPAYWGRGYAHQLDKDYSLAVADFNIVLKLAANNNTTGDFTDLYCNISYCQLQLKNYDDALKADSTALAINEKYQRAYIIRAIIHRAINKPELAIDDYTHAIQNFTGDNKDQASALLAERAEVKRLLKQYKAAINDFTLAIDLSPQNRYAYWNRAAAYYNNGDYKLATDDYTTAISFYKGDNINLSKLYADRANNETGQSLYTDAIKDDSIALSLEPNNTDAYYGRANAYTQNGDYQQGIDNYAKLLTIVDNNKFKALLYYQIANNEYFLNEFDKVVTDCSKAIAADSAYSESYYYRAKVYLKKMNNKELAVKDFNRVIALDTTKKTVSYIFSLFYLGKADDAVNVLNSEILATNNDAELLGDYYNMACLYALMNKPDEANIYLKKAIDNGYAKKYAIADEDLDNIRNTADYKSTIAGATH